VALGAALTVCFLRFGFARLRGPISMERGALWLHFCGRIVMASLGIRCRVTGHPPDRGLIVSNHLSYLDIVIYAATVPCFMVSKAELAGWPVFGFMSRASGTLYVDRSSRLSAIQVTEQVAERIKGPLPVLFFPEGTSTDGSGLLRFHSRLFTPAADAAMPVTTAAIRYVIADGTPERELCWFDDMLFLPHLWRTLCTAGFIAEVTFGEPRIYPDRRTAADRTYDEIAAMREQNVAAPLTSPAAQ